MLRTAIVIVFSFLTHPHLWAQYASPALPIVDVGEYAITHRIYVSPLGVDDASGTEGNPKRTLRAALDALPWPASGALYAEIVMASGTYRTGLVVSESDRKRGNLSRNISIRGVGNVIIDAFAMPLTGTQGALTVGGSHIRVQNVRIRSSTVCGVTVAEGSEHVVLDNITVDTCISHGLYVNLSNTVLVQNCTVTEACRYKIADKNRSWGSCIKLLYSADCTVRGCTVADGWGEGINVNRTTNVVLENNTVSNTYAGGVYIDMGAKVVVRSNLLYFDPADTTHRRFSIPAAGISLSNELHCGFNATCPNAIWTGTENCTYRCTGIGCEYTVPMNDSIEIYNNIVLNAGNGFEMFELFNGDCFRNIRIEFNTYAGSTGERNGSALTLLLDMLLREVRNIVIRGNLFLIDDRGQADLMGACRFADNVLTPIRAEIRTSENVWNTTPTCGLEHPSDTILPYRFTGVGPNQLSIIDPQATPGMRVHMASSRNITSDFYGRRRWNTTTAGAIDGADPTGVDAEVVPLAPYTEWIAYDMLGREISRGDSGNTDYKMIRGCFVMVYRGHGKHQSILRYQ